MHFYTYKITNLINGKIYIGVHKTDNLEDNYMGSGKILKRSIAKYGIENFKKDILMYHDSESDMFEMEALIVDQDFVDRKDTYNLKLGGFGGWDHINSDAYVISLRNKKRSATFVNKLNTDAKFNEEFCSKMSKIQKTLWTNPEFKKSALKAWKYDWTGKKHSDETKQKMSIAAKSRTPEQNSQFGKMWIYSLELKQSKRIDKNDPIPEGWNKGRKMFKGL
ncbi:putative Seg-like homing endonuclease GIY-YIG family [Acinetobacter phage Henu6]|uniref:Putative Seg-like homing endonuclease GIY-YIG family n=1 Tax=Acinetobacter phage Henu6 TaxID=2500136 RepID=A0A410T5I0_9CAUD|nr:putative Seg-like homing endonuclease GIY-YIG family [Acinetobacter phage Henu6]